MPYPAATNLQPCDLISIFLTLNPIVPQIQDSVEEQFQAEQAEARAAAAAAAGEEEGAQKLTKKQRAALERSAVQVTNVAHSNLGYNRVEW